MNSKNIALVAGAGMAALLAAACTSLNPAPSPTGGGGHPVNPSTSTAMAGPNLKTQTAGPGQSATVDMPVSYIDAKGWDSVTWSVKTVARAPHVELNGQGINTCSDPGVNTNNNTTVYPLGGSANSGPDVGSASWCPNPNYQFTTVYVTLRNNGAAKGTKPVIDTTTGKVTGVDLATTSNAAQGINDDWDLFWVTANGFSSPIDTSSNQGDAGAPVANALGVQSTNDLGGALDTLLGPGASASGFYSPSVGAGPGSFQVRDAKSHVLLVIPVK
jgi:hypothetical protein